MVLGKYLGDTTELKHPSSKEECVNRRGMTVGGGSLYLSINPYLSLGYCAWGYIMKGYYFPLPGLT